MGFLNVLSVETKGNRPEHYLLDDLGSPIRIIDGMTEELYGFDEFGNPLRDNVLRDVRGFGFTGYQWDEMAGTYFAQARQYDSKVGRFVSEDIVKGFGEVPQTLNPYAYCWNQPLGLVDLDGRLPSLVIPILPLTSLPEIVGDWIGENTGVQIIDEQKISIPGFGHGKRTEIGEINGSGTIHKVSNRFRVNIKGILALPILALNVILTNCLNSRLFSQFL
ncbi:MAG: RHS repeat-associated core domain-containing protein, partial [Lachnospiraceae bacterium]|nr:RHS repeat-associated core domain-containing protein [Lachnospiraceae bacterium]